MVTIPDLDSGDCRFEFCLPYIFFKRNLVVTNLFRNFVVSKNDNPMKKVTKRFPKIFLCKDKKVLWQVKNVVDFQYFLLEILKGNIEGYEFLHKEIYYPVDLVNKRVGISHDPLDKIIYEFECKGIVYFLGLKGSVNCTKLKNSFI